MLRGEQALLERPDRAGRGKTRDAKLALGAQNKESGKNPRFRGTAPPAPPRRQDGLLGRMTMTRAFRRVWFRLLSRRTGTIRAARQSGRGKTRDAKLALGAQNKGSGRIGQA